LGRFRPGAIALTAFWISTAPVLAQQSQDGSVEATTPEPPRPDEGRLVIDLAEAKKAREREPALEQRCEEETDAARVANEIIVCRDLGEGSDGVWSKAEWERRYAERTQGPKPIDVDGSGLHTPNGSRMTPIVTIRGCYAPPCPPEAALLIDVGALPDAPPGSDADRIARGLPPLNGEIGDVADAVSRRQVELGLPAPVLVATE